MRDHVIYESRLELSRLLFADFDPSVRAIVAQPFLLQTVVEEAAHDARVELPADVALVQELGWTLHGAVSHLAIRRHVYRDATQVAAERVIEMQVKSFLAGVRAVLAPAA